MTYVLIFVIAVLAIAVVLLAKRVHDGESLLRANREKLANRAQESANLRASLDRRKLTHTQNLENQERHYKNVIEDEKRKVALDWATKQQEVIAKYKEELRKQAQEIHDHYEKQVASLQELHRERNRLLIGYVEDLIEPTGMDNCVKVRCHTDEEGGLWARKFEADRNFPRGSFGIYRCKVCPRNPIYGDRYVHIATTDPELKMIMTDVPTFTLVHPRQQLFARFSPGDLANLRKKVQGE